jgi:hypothetical protein
MMLSKFWVLFSVLEIRCSPNGRRFHECWDTIGNPVETTNRKFSNNGKFIQALSTGESFIAASKWWYYCLIRSAYWRKCRKTKSRRWLGRNVFQPANSLLGWRNCTLIVCLSKKTASDSVQVIILVYTTSVQNSPRYSTIKKFAL